MRAQRPAASPSLPPDRTLLCALLVAVCATVLLFELDLLDFTRATQIAELAL